MSPFASPYASSGFANLRRLASPFGWGYKGWSPCLHRSQKTRGRPSLYLSHDTRNAWSFYYIWHSFGLLVFRNERILNLLSLLLQDFLLLSCLHVKANPALTGKASRSRQKRIHSRQKRIHSRQEQINSECDSFIVEVSLFSKCCYSSQQGIGVTRRVFRWHSLRVLYF